MWLLIRESARFEAACLVDVLRFACGRSMAVPESRRMKKTCGLPSAVSCPAESVPRWPTTNSAQFRSPPLFVSRLAFCRQLRYDTLRCVTFRVLRPKSDKTLLAASICHFLSPCIAACLADGHFRCQSKCASSLAVFPEHHAIRSIAFAWSLAGLQHSLVCQSGRRDKGLQPQFQRKLVDSMLHSASARSPNISKRPSYRRKMHVSSHQT